MQDIAQEIEMNRKTFPLLAVLLLAGACAKAPIETEVVPVEAAPVGFVKIGDQTCYAPVDMAGMARSEAQKTRMALQQEAMERWTGEYDETFRLSSKLVSRLENQMMTAPGDVQGILDEDFRLCEVWARGALSQANYEKELNHYIDGLSKDRCEPKMLANVGGQLQVSVDWQIPVDLCAGQRVHIKSSRGLYVIQPPKPGEAPLHMDATGHSADDRFDAFSLCTETGCLPGMLIGRFESWEGETHYFPVGLERIFEAPAHGQIQFQINDTDLLDNEFAVIDMVEEFLRIDVQSAP